MSSPVYSKRRVLLNGVSVTSDGGLPAFPTAGSRSSPLVFAGAMQNAKIGGAELVVADFTGISALDVKFQHSPDGVTWKDVVDEAGNNVAFTQATADGSEFIDVPDETFFERFVRAYCDVTGAGSATVTVRLAYRQCGPRDRLAPPGLVDRYN